MSQKKHIVVFTAEERQQLQAILDRGLHTAQHRKRAKVLLLAETGLNDPAVARKADVCVSAVYRIRRRCCEAGLTACLTEKPRSGRPRMLTGDDEAALTVLACSKPPVGRVHWTHRLLTDRLGELEIIGSIAHTTVGRLLDNSDLKPWQKLSWCIGSITSGYLIRMEDVLDVYALPSDPMWPQICVDERPCQLLGDILVPIPMQPGTRYRYDHHYERKGVCNLFIMIEPLTGFRFARISTQRTKIEYADFMKAVVELPRYADAEGFRLVQDNVNTHTAGTFYHAFEPEEA